MNINETGRPIILEGPDGSGKTTLGKHLADHLPGYNYIHSGGPTLTEHDYRCRLKGQQMTVKAFGGRAIIDRCPQISAQAYLNVGPESYDPYSTWVDDLQKINPILVFCTYVPDRSPEAKAKYIQDQCGKGHKSLEYAEMAWTEAEEVASKYRTLYALAIEFGFNVLSYNFEGQSLDKLLIKIEDLV